MKAPDILPTGVVCYSLALSIDDVVREWGLKVLEREQHNIRAVLPAGWHLVLPDTSFPGSRRKVVDGLGRPRAILIDRRMVLLRRYIVHEHLSESHMHISAQEKYPLRVLRNFGTCQKGDHYTRDDLRAEARAWLSREYPDHLNPFAYWDD